MQRGVMWWPAIGTELLYCGEAGRDILRSTEYFTPDKVSHFGKNLQIHRRKRFESHKILLPRFYIADHSGRAV
jgi:hypothetical protein